MYDQMRIYDDSEFVLKAKEFGAAHFSESNISQWYAEGGIPDSVMWSYKDSGLGYMGLSEKYGKEHIPLSLQMAVLEELTRLAGTTLPLQSQALSFNIISKIANKEQMEFLLNLYEETARPCFSTAITEAEAGSSLKTYKTTVEKIDGKYILNGKKVYVSNGMFAPYILVVLKDLTSTQKNGRDTFSIWLLPKDSLGVSVFPIAKIGQNIQSTAAITFENVELDEMWRLGDLSLNGAIYFVMNLGRCVVCSNSLGLAQAALDDAAAFADSHYINGEKIGSFQQIGLLLTKMQTLVFNMRAHTYSCARTLEEASDPKLAVSLMKYYVPQSAVKVADYAMQIFGGAGYSDSTRVSRIWIDSRANQFQTGTDQIMANTAAKEILKLYRNQSLPDS